MNERSRGTADPLQPEALRQLLAAGRFGKRIFYLPEIDSTNVFAYKRAQEGGAEGEIVIAETQTHGKGRLGRQWLSPPYMNLYMSVILRPTLAPVDTPQITLASAVALAETVESFASLRPEIKWPNDILVERKKLAGILTESCCDRSRVLFVIVGIGVNLNFPLEAMPEGIRKRATSLWTLTRKPVDRTAFAGQLIQNLDRCYGDLAAKGFAFTAQRWESYFRLKGETVRVESADQAFCGKALGVDSDGALLVQGEGGELQRVVAGDVNPVES